jgi:membrane-associated phospholipid phosphatase
MVSDAQEAPSETATDAQQQTPPDGQQAPQAPGQLPAVPAGDKPKSVLKIKPGSQVIKPKDEWDATGYFHPFVRMPRYVLVDQKAIWTSPFHTAKSDIKWWAILGGATAVLIATDRHTVALLPDSGSQVSVSTWASRIGSAYTLVPLTAGFYFIGTAAHDDHLRETGLLGFETLIDVNIVAEALKLAADRERPLEGDGKGHFWASSGSRWSSSFPSGHAINTWALASVLAHQYRHKKIVPILAYTLASTVVVARVGARQHFPGDVVAGAAMGWFIGDYVYGRRHNRDLDKKRTAADKILDHIHLGAELR